VLRAIFSLYPTRQGAAWLNRGLGRWFSRPESVWLHAPGRGRWPTMMLDIADDLQRKLFYFPHLYGRFYGRAPLARFLVEQLGPGGRFLDIGANVGFFSLLAARLVGSTGRVFAFEPEPRMHQAIARSAEVNAFTQLVAFPLALSDREGELPFYRARDGTASSLVAEVPGREDRYSAVTRARVTSLDALIARGELALPPVDVVKVDVEGEEVRTVRGMRGYLVASGYPMIWCEVRGPHGSTRAPSTFRGVVGELVPLGYRPHRLVRGVPHPIAIENVRDRADVLFMRREQVATRPVRHR
jgi:FkbM family methyltransferase